MGLKPDELEFAYFILQNDNRIASSYWENLSKRQQYILEKWTKKGWWDYGVSLRSGWLTLEGTDKLIELTKFQKTNM